MVSRNSETLPTDQKISNETHNTTSQSETKVGKEKFDDVKSTFRNSTCPNASHEDYKCGICDKIF